MVWAYSTLVHDTAETFPRMSNLDRGEYGIIWIIRRLVMARRWCPLVEAEMERLFRSHNRDVRIAIDLLLQQIADHGRRRLKLGLPTLPVMTMDEMLLLAILAAAQKNDSPRLQAHLSWLLGRAHTGKTAAAVTVIAAGLELNGHIVRTPPGPAPKALAGRFRHGDNQ